MPETSGETNVPIGDWTIGSLKVYHDEKILALKEHTQVHFTERDKALSAALISINERLKLLNELRDGVATKEQLEALEKVVDDLKDRLNRSDGKSSGLDKGWAILLGLVSGVVAVVGLILAFN